MIDRQRWSLAIEYQGRTFPMNEEINGRCGPPPVDDQGENGKEYFVRAGFCGEYCETRHPNHDAGSPDSNFSLFTTCTWDCKRNAKVRANGCQDFRGPDPGPPAWGKGIHMGGPGT